MASLYFSAVDNRVLLPPTKARGDSYQITQQKGSLPEITTQVSGPEKWTCLRGTTAFQIHSLDASPAYQVLRQEHGFAQGMTGFWQWLDETPNVHDHNEQIKAIMEEVRTAPLVDVSVKVDLAVSGLYPNLDVTATAYLLVFQVAHSSGETFYVASAANCARDVGAQDQIGQRLPVKGDSSDIDFFQRAVATG